MSTYFSLLQAVETSIQANQAFEGIPVHIRPRPAILRGNTPGGSANGDTLPMVVVSPALGWEQVAEFAFEEQVNVNFPVIVSIVIENEFDQAGLQTMMTGREALAYGTGSLFTINLPGGGTFDVEYNPAPSNVDASALPPPYFTSHQSFTYSVTMLRGNP